MGRIYPLINSIAVADHGFAVISGKASGNGIIYPRGKGVIIKEVGVPDITLVVKCWSIFTSVNEKEQRMNIDLPNRFTTNSLYTVQVSNNTYTNAMLVAYTVINEDKLWVEYAFTFKLQYQNIAQSLSATLKDSAGTIATFTVPSIQRLGRTIRSGGTFTFWSHSFGSTTVSWPFSEHRGNDVTLKNLGGGVHSIALKSWVIAETPNSRQNLEKYFTSMARDAIGRTGNLTLSDNIYNDCYFQNFTMSGNDTHVVTCDANFITSTKIYS